MHSWYIAALDGNQTLMRIVKGRAEAIAVACEMLDEGVEVTKLGPMLEMAQQEIDAAAIRRIWRERGQRRDVHPSGKA